MTAPRLVSFDLLIGADQLVLTFSETVHAATLEPTLFTLLSSRNVSDLISYPLTGSRGVSTTNSTIVTVDLLIDDLNTINVILTLVQHQKTHSSFTMFLQLKNLI